MTNTFPDANCSQYFASAAEPVALNDRIGRVDESSTEFRNRSVDPAPPANVNCTSDANTEPFELRFKISWRVTDPFGQAANVNFIPFAVSLKFSVAAIEKSAALLVGPVVPYPLEPIDQNMSPDSVAVGAANVPLARKQ